MTKYLIRTHKGMMGFHPQTIMGKNSTRYFGAAKHGHRIVTREIIVVWILQINSRNKKLFNYGHRYSYCDQQERPNKYTHLHQRTIT
jgi:hypothetical protein